MAKVKFSFPSYMTTFASLLITMAFAILPDYYTPFIKKYFWRIAPNPNLFLSGVHILQQMRLRIKISGHRVHDVGYRVFLLKHAMNLALPGLSTYNWNENGQQEVIVLVEGDEARISAFREKIEKEMPQLAEVSKITVEDYAGEVGRTGEVAMFCSFVQLDKAIPLLLEMKDDLKCLVTGQNEVVDETKGLREDMAVRDNVEWQVRVEKDIRIIKSKLGIR